MTFGGRPHLVREEANIETHPHSRGWVFGWGKNSTCFMNQTPFRIGGYPQERLTPDRLRCYLAGYGAGLAQGGRQGAQRR